MGLSRNEIPAREEGDFGQDWLGVIRVGGQTVGLRMDRFQQITARWLEPSEVERGGGEEEIQLAAIDPEKFQIVQCGIGAVVVEQGGRRVFQPGRLELKIDGWDCFSQQPTRIRLTEWQLADLLVSPPEEIDRSDLVVFVSDQGKTVYGLLGWGNGGDWTKLILICQPVQAGVEGTDQYNTITALGEFFYRCLDQMSAGQLRAQRKVDQAIEVAVKRGWIQFSGQGSWYYEGTAQDEEIGLKLLRLQAQVAVRMAAMYPEWRDHYLRELRKILPWYNPRSEKFDLEWPWAERQVVYLGPEKLEVLMKQAGGELVIRSEAETKRFDDDEYGRKLTQIELAEASLGLLAVNLNWSVAELLRLASTQRIELIGENNWRDLLAWLRYIQGVGLSYCQRIGQLRATPKLPRITAYEATEKADFSDLTSSAYVMFLNSRDLTFRQPHNYWAKEALQWLRRVYEIRKFLGLWPGGGQVRGYVERKIRDETWDIGLLKIFYYLRRLPRTAEELDQALEKAYDDSGGGSLGYWPRLTIIKFLLVTKIYRALQTEKLMMDQKPRDELREAFWADQVYRFSDMILALEGELRRK